MSTSSSLLFPEIILLSSIFKSPYLNMKELILIYLQYSLNQQGLTPSSPCQSPHGCNPILSGHYIDPHHRNRQQALTHILQPVSPSYFLIPVSVSGLSSNPLREPVLTGEYSHSGWHPQNCHRVM